MTTNAQALHATTATDLRRCPKCDQIKPLNAFGSNLSTPTGKDYRCKACESKRSQATRDRYRERNLRRRELESSGAA